MALSSAPSQPAVESSRLPQWERVVVGALFLLILGLKIWCLRAHSINSDEPQHLHVAWGWTQEGMVQYRDFFDNHAPLFHLAMAPLVAWMGEQADILFKMRLAMLPLFAASLGCIYWLGARLSSPRAGLWAVLLAATCPVFLFKSSEFRADVLWMTVWFATLAVGLTGQCTRRRAFATGLLLGVAFAVSMKTVLLLACLLAALGLIFVLLPKPERQAFLMACAGNALPALAGLSIVPLAVAGFFAAKGALPQLLYCVFEHNTIPWHGSGLLQRLWRLIIFLVQLFLIVLGGKAILCSGTEPSRALRCALVFFIGTLFLIVLPRFWPHVTSQDYLPVVPLLTLSITLWVLYFGKAGITILLLAVVVQIGMVMDAQSPLVPRGNRDQNLVGYALQLTKPTDFVMDSKGETVFRQRPFRYVLETLTEKRMELGTIRDTIPEDMVATRTCVALLKRMPEKSRQWVTKYYVPVTRQLLVTGCFLPAVQEGGGARPFEVAIPAEYVVASVEGSVPGMMDGVACAGPVFLDAGPHTFSCVESRPLAVFWAQAAATGFTPFQAAQKKD